MRRIFFVFFVIIALGIIMFFGCSDDNGTSDDGFEYECDPNQPVVLNGDTIPEGEIITRSPTGCVVGIHIRGIPIYDTDFIVGIDAYGATLEELIIDEIFEDALLTVNLTPLSDCTNLNRLQINNSNFTSLDISSLSSSGSIEWLCISRHASLTNIDLSPLSSCSGLKKLHVNNNGGLTSLDLSPLSSCINLEELNLSSIIIFPDPAFTAIDLSSLSSCTKLKVLDMYYNIRLASIDLSPLWDLDSLEFLDLSYCGFDGDSASCAQVCQFIDEHPDCEVYHDCDCEGK